MAFNGSGAFVRLYNWVADRNAAIKIRADRMDAEMDGFATGLSNTITRDGQSTVTVDIPWNGKKITSLGDATAGTDAMNRQSSDARYTPRFVIKTANYTLLLADIGSYFSGTGTWTLALPAVATTANGFSFQIKNAGAGVITIDPNGAETIDGIATLALGAGQEVLVVSDGAVWRTDYTSNFTSYIRPLLAATSQDTALAAIGAAPKPANAGRGVWGPINTGLGVAAVLPAGGTYSYAVLSRDAAGAVNNAFVGGVAAGGATVAAATVGYNWTGFYWNLT